MRIIDAPKLSKVESTSQIRCDDGFQGIWRMCAVCVAFCRPGFKKIIIFNIFCASPLRQHNGSISQIKVQCIEAASQWRITAAHIFRRWRWIKVETLRRVCASTVI